MQTVKNKSGEIKLFCITCTKTNISEGKKTWRDEMSSSCQAYQAINTSTGKPLDLPLVCVCVCVCVCRTHSENERERESQRERERRRLKIVKKK